MAMSTEGKIGIGLTLLFAIGSGGVLVAPGQQTWIGWGTIIISLFGVFVLGISHAFEALAFRKVRKKMISIAGMIISALCFFGFLILFFWPAAYGSKTIGPMLWYFPPGIQLALDDQKQLRVFALTIAVKNVSDDLQRLKSVTIRSTTSGDKLELGILDGNDVVPLSDAKPITPNNQANLIFKFGQTLGPDKGPSATDFISKWSKIRVVAKYEGHEYRETFDLEPEIRKAMGAQ